MSWNKIILISFTFFCFSSWSLVTNAQSKSLEQAIQQINQKAQASGSQIRELTKEGFYDWYLTHQFLSYTKQNRTVLDSIFSTGYLKDDLYFELVDYSSMGIPVRIVLTKPFVMNQPSFSSTVIEGNNYQTWEALNIPPLTATPANLDESLFTGKTKDINYDGNFPSSVPIRLQPIRLTYKKFSADALSLEMYVTNANANDLAEYFENAYSKQFILEKIKMALHNSKGTWISLDKLLEGWISRWLNHFPGEKEIADGGIYPNDVCHGSARQFFSLELKNGGNDRSTNATELLLKTDYLRLPEGANPAFGDYFYLPSSHSIRFVLKDPVSKRAIGISSWSSQETPYRLWWIDQDYSPPSEKMSPPPRPEYPSTFDVWRRQNKK